MVTLTDAEVMALGKARDVTLPAQPIPAPRYCFACITPKVRDAACRYCQRYERACGRHDTNHTH